MWTGFHRPRYSSTNCVGLVLLLAGKLVLFFPDFLAVPLASQSFLHATLLAWLQVEGVALDLLDDVFGLHLALETAQSILKGLAFLHTNLCHLDTPPNLPAGET